MRIPDWWQAALLSLAAFRAFRLLGYDVILDAPRDVLTRRSKWQEGKHRVGLDMWLHCPWCFGAWVSIGWWLAWEAWPHFTMVAAAPFAISAVVGLVTKNLDP